MDTIARLIAMLLVLLPLWAALSSPVLIAFCWLARRMRQKSVRSPSSIAALAFAFSLLAAPVPTPIMTVLIPHGLSLIDRWHYPNLLQGPAALAELSWWNASSLMLTFVVSLVAAWRYIRPRPSRPLHEPA